MKNLFVLSLLLMCLVTKNYAQDVITPAAAKETATSNLINSVITIDDKTIDYRILKHCMIQVELMPLNILQQKLQEIK